jgi:hypothetical protein
MAVGLKLSRFYQINLILWWHDPPCYGATVCTIGFSGSWYLATATKMANRCLLFRRLGVDVTGMPSDALREARRQLIHRHHPDRGGDLDTAQSINAAYDLIKDGVPKYRGSAFGLSSFRRAHQRRREQVAALKLCYPEHPEWVWAGCSGDIPGRSDIRNQDFTDINFIKKSMWELSGRSESEYTIWGFDGHVFRGHVTVFGSPKIFNYMADAMLTSQAKGSNRHECRAVFVHEEGSGDFYLIYADGKHYGDGPIKMKHYSFNCNPGHDQDFVRELPDLLNRLREQ